MQENIKIILIGLVQDKIQEAEKRLQDPISPSDISHKAYVQGIRLHIEVHVKIKNYLELL